MEQKRKKSIRSQIEKIAKEKFKIVLLGEERVGKTSLIQRYVNNKFDSNQPKTVPDFQIQENKCYQEKQLFLQNEQQMVKLALWDTAGEERFSAVAPMYYRNADGAVIVYDISNNDTLKKVYKWIEELKQFSYNKNLIICVVGNKYDLQNSRNDHREGEKLAKSLNLQHYYTSCKADTGIQECFLYLAEKKVGKTSIIEKYINDKFDPYQPKTIPEFSNDENKCYKEKNLQIQEKNFTLALWDTAGEDKFSAMAPMYYRNADAAIIVYDISNNESLKRINKWTEELKQFSQNPNLIICIVGNKYDLQNSRNDNKQGENIATLLKLQHFYTSCKAGSGISECFQYIAQNILPLDDVDILDKNFALSNSSHSNYKLQGKKNEKIEDTNQSCC